MVAPANTIDDGIPAEDQFVYLHGVSWADYQRLLTIRGDHGVPRIAYLGGEVELMSPSRHHERIKKCLARLVEAYADERGIFLDGIGEWTISSELQARGVEPDECYTFTPREDRPDLALEVIWTSGGLDKLDIYRGLGVPEVWIWRKERLSVHALRDGVYVEVERSVGLPELDLALLRRFVTAEGHVEAVRAYRRALQRP